MGRTKTVEENPKTAEQQAKVLRMLVGNLYDIQKLRVADGNRVVASIRPDLMPTKGAKVHDDADDGGLDDEEAKKERAKEKERNSVLSKVQSEFKRITDVYIAEFKGKGNIEKSIQRLGSELAYIKSGLDYKMVETYDKLLKIEEDQANTIAKEVKKHPMWDEFFSNVLGCGPVCAAICISYFDIHKATYPSCLWRYAGLDVTPEGEGRSRWHKVTQQYIDSEGETRTKNGLGYNPFLKSKLLGVLGGCFLKVGGKYDAIYRDYRNRLENRSDLQHSSWGIWCKDAGVIEDIYIQTGDMVTKGQVVMTIRTDDKVVKVKASGDGEVTSINVDIGDKVSKRKHLGSIKVKSKPMTRIHRMALRYAVKQFLVDMWVAWRKLEGYEIGDPYYVAKLGMEPHHVSTDYARADAEARERLSERAKKRKETQAAKKAAENDATSDGGGEDDGEDDDTEDDAG